MERKDLDAYLDEVFNVMKKAGFTASIISYPEDKRSIDVVGARNRKRVIIKITLNTRHLSPTEYNDLKKASKAYDASPLIISEETEQGSVEEDVVIKKKGLNIVSIELFKNYLLTRSKPLVYKYRGTYLVRINPEKFREKREKELRYSLGELAEIIGVSRKAIYEYERGEIDVSIDTAIRIAEVMGEDVFETIDLFEEKIDPSIVKDDVPRTSLEKTIYTLCNELSNVFCGFYKLVKTPIDYILRIDNRILSIICRDHVNDFEVKVNEGVRISKVFKTHKYVINDLSNTHNIKKDIIEILRK